MHPQYPGPHLQGDFGPPWFGPPRPWLGYEPASDMHYTGSHNSYSYSGMPSPYNGSDLGPPRSWLGYEPDNDMHYTSYSKQSYSGMPSPCNKPHLGPSWLDPRACLNYFHDRDIHSAWNPSNQSPWCMPRPDAAHRLQGAFGPPWNHGPSRPRMGPFPERDIHNDRNHSNQCMPRPDAAHRLQGAFGPPWIHSPPRPKLHFLESGIAGLQISTGKGKKKKKKTKQTEEAIGIKVDPLTDNPSMAWEVRFEGSHEVTGLNPPDFFLCRPRAQKCLRFVCMSDTHSVIEDGWREFAKRIPDGDVLIHSGDFTMAGEPSEVRKFDSFLSGLPHPVKLVIAGNHETAFEMNTSPGDPTLVRHQLGLPMDASEEEVVNGCKDLLKHALYLEDESLTICGIKLYGTPWVPTYKFGSRGFSLSRGESLLKMWDKIPSDTDILITHSPPCGYGDIVNSSGTRAGCVELLNTVVHRVQPKFHVFGHIHNGYGMGTNGTTTFINSSVCSNRYSPDNDPIVFDCPLPEGCSRKHFARLSTETLRRDKLKLQTKKSQKSKVKNLKLK